MMNQVLEMLLSTMSVSGEEKDLQEYIRDDISAYVDQCEGDAVGNLIFGNEGNSQRRILLAAHADEIGLMVCGVTSDGFLKVTNAGGVIVRTYPGNAVKIKTKKGCVSGVVVVDKEKLSGDKFQVKDLRIDIGAKSKEEALSNICMGDTIVSDTSIKYLLNGRLAARGMDDKCGVYVITEAIKRAIKLKSEHGIYGITTVGEETSMHGARWGAERLKPTEAIIVDVTYTSDCDGYRSAEWGEIELGKGPVLCINPICDKEMNQKLMNIAEEKNIPYQLEISGGRSCTDADAIHVSGEGVRVALVYVPLRYMHSPYEVLDEVDLEGAIRLLTAYLVG